MNKFSFGKAFFACKSARLPFFFRSAKLTLTFIMFFLSSVFAVGNAQKISLSLLNVKLEEAFKQISQQTSYKFLYNDEVIKKSANVTVDVRDAKLEDVLHLLLPSRNYSFKIIAETISVVYKEGAPGINTAQVSSQNRISGTVKSKDGTALVGASIVVKGTSVGATTDNTGSFSITANTNAVLVIRYVGYKAKEVVASGKQDLHIILENDESTIDAVNVVATGYQNLDRKLFTGASTRVLAKDAERSGVPDISRMLEGQVAGVAVQNVSGTFGAAPKITVRGATSLSGDNKPLWVIDGIILEDVVNISNEALSTGDANTLIGSSVAGLNPDDIESFTILKDAAATAMYGARAMNGVIVVNTKRGKNTEGKPLINYSGTLTTYLKPSYSQFDIMNSAEQMSILLELENKGYFNHSGVSRSSTGGIFYKMYNKMYDYDEATDSFGLKNTLEDRLNFLSRYTKANTDWFDVLFKNSLLQEHSLSINSGSARSQTYFSTSLTSDNGQTMGDKVKRYTANLRNNITISDKVSAEVLVSTSIRDQRAPGTLTRQSDPVFGQYSRDFDINPYSYALNTSRLITPYDEQGNLEYFVRNYGDFNIINELQNNVLNLEMLDIKVQGGIKYKIIPKLIYSIDGAYRYAKTERQHSMMEESNIIKSYLANGDATIANANKWLYKDPSFPNNPPVVVLPEGGFFNTKTNNLKNYYLRQNLEYNNTFANDHRVNIFGSMEVRYTDRQNLSYDGVGYQFANGGLVNPNYRYFKKMIEGGTPYFGMDYGYDRFAAMMVRSAYAFKDKYSVNFTARYDGANQLGKSRVARWLPTWNISGKWNIDQESFFKPNNLVNAWSLRATYGLTASLGAARNSSPVFYNEVSRRPYEDEKESLITISSLANSKLTWEKMYETNIGTDLNLFNNKVELTMDWYKRNIFDLIGSIRTSGIGGQFTKQANYGEMKASGFEFTVAGSPFKDPNGFRWRTQLNFAHNTNKVTNLAVNQSIWTMVRAEGAAAEGHSQRGLYSIQFDGLDPRYGYPTFIGTDGVKDTYINLQSQTIDYLTYHGPVNPTFNGGYFNQFGYKNLTLSALFTFAAGNYIRLQPDYSSSYSDMQTISKDMVNRWLIPGDEKYTTIPSLLDSYVKNNGVLRANGATVDATYPYNAYNYSTERVAKGDYIRLKQLSLGYSVPKEWLKRAKINSLQVSLIANNVVLLYSDKKLNGADPEFFNSGGVAMPVPRQFTLSFKLGL